MVFEATDLADCRQLWERAVPDQGLFGLWDVRYCFQKHYGYKPHFLVSERGGAIRGFIALCEISDHGYWGCFPGETYKGKTWLEQNPLIADSAETVEELLDRCSAPVRMRYLLGDQSAEGHARLPVDEVGYLFRPPDYGFSFDRYLAAFSGKSRKKLNRELDALASRGLTVRHDTEGDVEEAFRLNLAAFGSESYFADDRFLDSFRSLAGLLGRRGMLRVTAVLIGGRLAAVDLGALYRGVYTLLAGGTDPAFPGVAKWVNLHHMEWACRQRLECVDFLCGDFGWKSRFHLSPRPLHQLVVPPLPADETTRGEEVVANVI